MKLEPEEEDDFEADPVDAFGPVPVDEFEADPEKADKSTQTPRLIPLQEMDEIDLNG